MLCETWTNDVSDVDVEGYVRVSKVRRLKRHSKRGSGGLEVYLKDSCIKGIKIEELENEDGLNFKFDKDFFGWDKDMFLFFVYFKPKDSSRQDLDNDSDCFDKLLNQIAKVNDEGNILIAGDLNCRVSDRQECKIDVDINDDLYMLSSTINNNVFSSLDFIESRMSVKRANLDKNVNDYGSKLLQLCTSCDLAMLNGRAGSDKGKGTTTFCGPRGESTVDYVLCDKYVLKSVKQFDISDIVCFSDHKMLSFKLNVCFSENYIHDQEINEHDCIKRIPKWKEANKDAFVNKLNDNITDTKIYEMINTLTNNVNDECLDNIVCELSDIIVNAGSDHYVKVGANKVVIKGGKWYDDECKTERNEFLRLKHIFLSNDTDANRVEMCKQRSKYRQICRKKKRLFNRKEAEHLVALSKADPKKFWKVLKGNKKRNDKTEIDFHDHFKKLAIRDTSLNDVGQDEVERLSEMEDNIVHDLDKEVTIDELEKAIKDLKKGKSAGSDGIVNEFIINASFSVKLLLITIFNSILILEHFPDKWCVGSIIPIFKSGDKGAATNYRGITLLSVVGKLFTKIMNTRFNEWAEREDVLTEAQFGFRKGRGTTDCSFILHGLIEKMINNGEKLFAVFIDYEKAFDYLDRGAIWAKLFKGGLSSKCIRVFQSMYNKMKLEVKQSKNNDYFESNAGILQGESTSPIFFSFFVNDLENNLNEDSVGINLYDIFLKLLMYADDMVIFSKTIKGLQEGLNSLDLYCKTWDISVNTRKTKVVVFTKGGRINRSYIWRFRNVTLEVVSVFKYLGLHFSSTGSFAAKFVSHRLKCPRWYFYPKTDGNPL